MANTYWKMTPAQKVNLAEVIATGIGEELPNDYGVSEAQILALTGGKTALSTALQTQADAKAAFHTATGDKNTKDQALLDAIASIAGTAYGNPAVTDQMLQTIGLAPRDTQRTPRLPVEPANLVANAFANGKVTLQWERNGNGYPMTFVIEQQKPGGVWTIIDSVTRSKVSLFGYTPGEVVAFRVSAKNGSLTSGPSNIATIYYSDPGVQLSIAA